MIQCHPVRSFIDKRCLSAELAVRFNGIPVRFIPFDICDIKVSSIGRADNAVRFADIISYYDGFLRFSWRKVVDFLPRYFWLFPGPIIAQIKGVCKVDATFLVCPKIIWTIQFLSIDSCQQDGNLTIFAD